MQAGDPVRPAHAIAMQAVKGTILHARRWTVVVPFRSTAGRQPSTVTRRCNAKGRQPASPGPEMRPRSALLVGRCAPCTSPAKMPDGCWMEGGPGQAPLLGYTSLHYYRRSRCCVVFTCNANACRAPSVVRWHWRMPITSAFSLSESSVQTT